MWWTWEFHCSVQCMEGLHSSLSTQMLSKALTYSQNITIQKRIRGLFLALMARQFCFSHSWPNPAPHRAHPMPRRSLNMSRDTDLSLLIEPYFWKIELIMVEAGVCSSVSCTYAASPPGFGPSQHRETLLEQRLITACLWHLFLQSECLCYTKTNGGNRQNFHRWSSNVWLLSSELKFPFLVLDQSWIRWTLCFLWWWGLTSESVDYPSQSWKKEMYRPAAWRQKYPRRRPRMPRLSWN